MQRFVDDEPIRARRASLAERSWRWCKRNPVVAGLTAALVLVFLAAAYNRDRILVWEVAHGALKHNITSDVGWVRDLVFSAAGHDLAYAVPTSAELPMSPSVRTAAIWRPQARTARSGSGTRPAAGSFTS